MHLAGVGYGRVGQNEAGTIGRLSQIGSVYSCTFRRPPSESRTTTFRTTPSSLPDPRTLPPPFPSVFHIIRHFFHYLRVWVESLRPETQPPSIVGPQQRYHRGSACHFSPNIAAPSPCAFCFRLSGPDSWRICLELRGRKGKHRKFSQFVSPTVTRSIVLHPSTFPSQAPTHHPLYFTHPGQPGSEAKSALPIPLLFEWSRLPCRLKNLDPFPPPSLPLHNRYLSP